MPSASGSFTFPFYLRLSVATSQLSSRSSMILSIKLVAPAWYSVPPPLPFLSHIPTLLNPAHVLLSSPRVDAYLAFYVTPFPSRFR